MRFAIANESQGLRLQTWRIMITDALTNPVTEISPDQMRALYQSFGVTFQGEFARIPVGQSGIIEVPAEYLLQPSPEGCARLKETVEREAGIAIEIFDPKDSKYQAGSKGEMVRYFGRVFHHFEIIRWKKVNFYTYLKLSAPSEAVSPESWEKLGQFLVCVLGILSVIVLLGIVRSPMAISSALPLLGAAAAACMAFLTTVSDGERDNAWLSTPVER